MERINVTKSFLPPIEEYQQYLDQIWSTAWLTNQGPLLQEFEQKVSGYLGVSGLHFVTNGTLALLVALRALDINDGEVITTPFSYVATTSSILWERCKPVFVDIDPASFCIDADKIEAAITKNTRAIMPVHVFGRPCDTEKIDAIAKKHHLKVIYDAAHAFGVTYQGKPILSYGDISICSFHATKLFHTIEGGCLVARDKELSDKIELIKRFGHNGDDEHYMLGINVKASEFQAAMGLCNLKYITEIIRKREAACKLYDKLLGDAFPRQEINKDTDYNYAYYPLLFKSETQLKEKMEALKAKNIFPRRYFYPSLNTLPYLQTTQSCPLSEDIAKRVACMPLYADISEEVIRTICDILKK